MKVPVFTVWLDGHARKVREQDLADVLDRAFAAGQKIEWNVSAWIEEEHVDEFVKGARGAAATALPSAAADPFQGSAAPRGRLRGGRRGRRDGAETAAQELERPPWMADAGAAAARA